MKGVFGTKIKHWGVRLLLRLKSIIHDLLKSVRPSRRLWSSVPNPHRFLLRLFLFLLIPCTLYLIPAMLTAAFAANVTLGWEPNPEPDLKGYVVYRNIGSPGPPYGYSSDLPEDDLANPLQPKVTLTGLQEGNQYYIALTAYNTEGVESSFSNDVCVEISGGSIDVCSQSISLGSASGGGGSGGGCFISSTRHHSSIFSKFVVEPIIRNLLLAILFLLLVLIAAVKLGFNKTDQHKNRKP